MNILPPETFWILSGFILFAVAWVQFNKPPTNRSSTTFLLFYTGVIFYYALLVALWLLVILMLNGTGAGLSWIGKGFSLNKDAQLNGALPLVAVLIIAAASRFNRLRSIDTAARSLCIELAAIPRQADDLATELANRAEFRIHDQQLVRDVSREITENIGTNALDFANDGTVPSRFTRAVSLYWLFIVPFDTSGPLRFLTNAADRSTYTRIMRLNNRTVDHATKLYNSLIEGGLAYFSPAKGSRRLEEQLNDKIQALSFVVCSLIARYSLFKKITISQRRKRLASMGFVNLQDRLPAFGRDQWIATILAVIVLFAFLSILLPGRQPYPVVLLYSVLAAVQLGIASIAGTVVAQRFIRREEAVSQRFPPLAELLVAVLVVMAVCIVLRICWFVVPNLIKTGEIGLKQSIDIFLQRWAFLLMPFSCTISIGLLCSYLGMSSWSWIRLAALGGSLNGLALAFAGFLMSCLLPEELLPQFESQPEFGKLVLMSTVGIVGIAVGAIVLAIFPRSVRADREAIRVGANAPSYKRAFATIRNPAAEVPKEIILAAYATVPQDLGGYATQSAKELEGRYVCFRPSFHVSDVIHSYIVLIRWDEERSCLIFEEQSRPDSVHTQKGLVYLPDGKPFLNLVTMDKGSVRLIMVARPVEGIARGIILTLSTPRGTHFTPMAAPVVFRRLGEVTPQLGFVHRNAPDYDLYHMQLASVVPDFGDFALPLFASASTTHPIQPPNPEGARRRRTKVSAG